MKEILKQTLEILRRRVRYNLSIIHKNEKYVREILQEPVSSDRSERLDEKFNTNKSMLEENNDSIKIQLSIIKFLDKYGIRFDEFNEFIENNPEENNSLIIENLVSSETKELTWDDYFDLTILKGIDFDERHPYFENQEFFDELMIYFTDVEDYEMCSKLVASRKKDDAYLS